MNKWFLLSLGLLASVVFAQDGDMTSTEEDNSATPTEQTQLTPAQQADAEAAGLGEWLSNTDAQNKSLELMQQGKYVRKSLLIVPMLFWMGDGFDDIRTRHKPVIVQALRDSLMRMSRFDINPLSSHSYAGLRDAWNNTWFDHSVRNMFNPKKREEILSKLVEEHLTPDLLGAMSAAMKERAGKDLTNEQMNSFMVDKAKESGVTAAELNLVLNSGYIVVPVSRYLAYGIDDQGNYKATIHGGLILYKVQVDKDRAWLEKRKEIFRIGDAVISKKDARDPSTFPFYLRNLPASEVVMYEAIDMMLNSAMQDMRDLKEFRLLSQMSSGDGSTYEIPFGPGEIKDVPMDKFFEHVEQVQAKDGSVKEEVTGWGFVKKPVNFKYPIRKPDTTITDYIWQGYAVTGDVMSGIVTREYSRLPVDVDFRAGIANIGVVVPADGMGGVLQAYDSTGLVDTVNTIEGIGAYAQIQVKTSLAPWTGISQLYLRLNSSVKICTLDSNLLILTNPLTYSNYPVDNFMQWNAGLGVEKKWWLSRFVPTAGFDLFYGQTYINGSSGVYSASLKDDIIGAKATADLEFAFTPNFRVGLTGAGLFTLNLQDWSYSGDESGKVSDVISSTAEIATVAPLSFEVGAYLTFNAWPLQKLYDAVASKGTTGLAGAINKGKLTPIY